MALLPESIADARFRKLEELLEERIVGLDLTQLLIKLVEQGPEAALPSLGWEFGALDDLWNSATSEERKALLKRALARKRHGGTPWAVKDALAAIGYAQADAYLQHRPKAYANGTLYANGTFHANLDGNHFVLWLVLVSSLLDEDELVRVRAAVKNAPKQKSVLFEGVYYVENADDFGDLSAYTSATTWAPTPEERGLSLLSSALGWWDVLHTAPIATDVSFDPDITNWAQTNCTVTAGIADPDGGTSAYRVTASGAGTVRVQHPISGVARAGYAVLRGSIKVTDDAPVGSSAVTAATSIPGGSSYLNFYRPSADSDVSIGAYLHPSGNNSLLGFDKEDLGGDWFGFSVESLLTEESGAVYARYPGRVEAVATGVGAVFELYDLSWSQSRVGTVLARVGGTHLTQSANEQKPTIARNVWLGNDCVIGAPRSTQELSASVAVGNGAWCAFATIQPTRRQAFVGGLPDIVLELTGTTCKAAITVVPAAEGNDHHGSWGWSWTNDEGTVTTGTFGGYIPAVPVAAALKYDGANLSLYIDGVQVGSAAPVAGTATVTGFAIRGNESRTAWVSAAVLLGAFTDVDISDVCLALRAEATLPSRWKLVHHSGQSNSTSTGVINAKYARAPFALGCAWTRRESSNTIVAPWCAQIPIYWADSALNVHWGPSRAFLASSIAHADYGYCVISTGLGASFIEYFMSTGDPDPDMYAATRAAWSEALEHFGTHLHERALSTWIQGEANATYGTSWPGGYQGALAALFENDVADFGGPLASVILRLNENFVSGTPESRAALRSAQDAYAASEPLCKIYAQNFTTPRFDGIHYDLRAGRAVGWNMYAAFAGTAEIEP